MAFPIISEEDVRRIISPGDAIAAVREAHEALAAKRTINVPRSRARAGRFCLHSLSAIDTDHDLAGAKVYSSLGSMAASHVLLYRTSTGELLAMIEAAELGRLRTAGAAVLSAQVMAPSTSHVLGIIGAGFQAEGVVRAFLSPESGFSFSRVLLASRSEDRCREAAAHLTTNCGQTVEAAPSVREVCSSADILVTATTSSEPLFEHAWLTSVRHIAALGANSLARRELPTRTLLSASLLAVDDIDTAKLECGNLLPAVEAGRAHWTHLCELGSLLRSSPPTVASGYTVFLSHGLGAQDLHLARVVYDRFAGR